MRIFLYPETSVVIATIIGALFFCFLIYIDDKHNDN